MKGFWQETDPDACFTYGKTGHWASDCRQGKSQAPKKKGKAKAQLTLLPCYWGDLLFTQKRKHPRICLYRLTYSFLPESIGTRP